MAALLGAQERAAMYLNAPLSRWFQTTDAKLGNNFSAIKVTGPKRPSTSCLRNRMCSTDSAGPIDLTIKLIKSRGAAAL